MEPHLARRIFGTLAAGPLAGAVGGLGARLAMRIIALLSPSHLGEITHEGAVNGRITAAGTLNLVVEGAVPGLLGAILFLAVRRWLPRQSVVRGLVFGIGLLACVGGAVLDPGNYEFTRFVSLYLALGMFAVLFPIYGVALVVVARRFGADPAPVRETGPVVLLAGRIVLLLAVAAGATWQLAAVSRVQTTAPVLVRVAPPVDGGAPSLSRRAETGLMKTWQLR